MFDCSCGGGYINVTGVCQACEVGLYRSLDMLACSPCPNNTYAGHEPGAFRCTSCPANRISPAGSINSSQCVCAPGYTYKVRGENKTRSPCAPCGPGKFKAVEGPANCTLCPSGLIAAPPPPFLKYIHTARLRDGI